jgi:hypothetical protein
VVLRLKSGDELAPGQTGEVVLSPLAYETWPDVKPGTNFDIYDAGRAVGKGTLRSTPTSADSEPELRRAVSNAFEEWLRERFGDRVEKRPRDRTGLEPDLVAWFDDDEGGRHGLVAEVVARRLDPRHVNRLARLMNHYKASIGLLVALDAPSARTLDAIYRHGTVALSSQVRASRIRVVTTRDLGRNNIELVPTSWKPETLEVLAA